MFHVRMGVGLFLALLGFAGSILPVLPGVVFSLLGMLVVEFSTVVDFSITAWSIVIVLIALAIVSDYIFPLIGAHRGGGTKAGTRGSLIGMLLGVFFTPRGLIIGPLLGAFVGEFLTKKDTTQARQAARGSFLGSTASTVIKLIAAGVVVYYIVIAWMM